MYDKMEAFLLYSILLIAPPADFKLALNQQEENINEDS
jgi:hypothetical protein